ncbi:MAG: UDP-N-acetylglucosamine 1-carboxyvinyltransferase, partial [Ignavibacteria bacterium]|nr:UDP-N-acetylglucosamine 1-carboxyvinyltransferase [Ignavibacteria bacterium]
MSDSNSKFIVQGGNPLHGNIKVSGSKNAAPKLLVASMLSDKPSVLRNSPNKISDLNINKEICENLGAEISITEDTLKIQTEKFTKSIISEELGNLTRIAVLMAGPLLNRTGKAEIPIPGGCKIGAR